MKFAWRQAWKQHWRRALRHISVIGIAIVFLGFARDPLIDIALDSVPISAMPLLFKSQGLTTLGYGAVGSSVVLAVFVIFAAPYWLMSKILGLPVRDDIVRR